MLVDLVRMGDDCLKPVGGQDKSDIDIDHEGDMLM